MMLPVHVLPRVFGKLFGFLLPDGIIKLLYHVLLPTLSFMVIREAFS